MVVIPNTPARGQLFINLVTLYAYDAADDAIDDKFATVLEGFIIIYSIQVAQTNTKKVAALDHLVLMKKWGISPKKALNIIICTTQHSVYTVLHPSLFRQLRANYGQ